MGKTDEAEGASRPPATQAHTTRDVCVACAARDRAEPDARARGAFLANMSHELRTPLNGIIGFSELLEAEHIGPLNRDQRTYVEHILTSGRLLLSLVNDLLDLTKLDAGRLSLVREWSSIDSIIEGAESQVARAAQSQGAKLDVQLAPDSPVIFVDPFRVRQIVSNLLGLCLKRLPEGGSISLRVAAEGPAVRIILDDDGPSLGEDEIRRLFHAMEGLDVFTDADADTPDLSLALTKRLLDMHGGTLEMTSRGDVGGRFEIVLPSGKHASETASMPPLERSPADEIVLVVDDDPQARELIAGHLRAAGVGVIFARNAEAAIELAASMHPSAITLDIEMPGTDGWAALQQLKRSPATRSIPVIVVSIVDEALRARRLGASGFEAKPVTKQGLLRVLSRAGVTLHMLEGTRVRVLDRDNPDFDRIEAKLRRAGCEVVRADADGRDDPTTATDLVVLDTTTAKQDLDRWLERAGGTLPPCLVVGVDAAAMERVAVTGAVHARTTLDEITGFPERLIRLARALLDQHHAQNALGDAHDAG